MNNKKNIIFQKKDCITLGILGFFEFCISSFFTAILPKDPGNSFLFGLSAGRVVILTAILFLALLFLLTAILAFKNRYIINKLFENPNTLFQKTIISISFLIIVLGWTAIFSPPELFGKLAYYFERLQPIAIASGLVVFQIWLTYWIRSHRLTNLSSLFHKKYLKLRSFWVTLIILLVFLIFAYISKFGILLNTPGLWNVPGIPVSSLQLFLIVLTLIIFLFLETRLSWFSKLLSNKKALLIIPFAIYIVTVLVWGLTPLNSHYFSLEPTAPNFQPFPYSDARVHDLGALSILFGNGIYFHGFTDKPLYMVILAIFHLFAGNDYVLLTWVQIIFLAFIPVTAFYLGKKFHSSIFGILIASFLIIQQRNAIELSKNIASVNVKLLVTEGAALFGVVILVLLFFEFYKTNDKRHAFLLGGVIGALSLIRLNPILFLPAAGLLIILFYWKFRKQMISQIILLFCGFLIVFSPWIISGINPQGQPWFLIKIKDVIESRINPTTEKSIFTNDSHPSDPDKKPSILVPVDPIMKNVEEVIGMPNIEQFMGLYFNHFSHNIITSLLALPDSLTYQKIIPLSQREYWNDNNQWDGNLPVSQLLLIIVNLLIFSLGIAYGWRHHRWGGLIPGFCFLIYDLGLSFSLTSGGRYIVPINWIVFFYYGLGILSILKFFFVAFKSHQESVPPILAIEIGKNNRSNSIVPALIGLLIIASLIPVTNLLLPDIIVKKSTQSPVEILTSFGIGIRIENSYIVGVILYPYYGSSALSFTILHDQQVNEFEVPIKQIQNSKIWLNSGESSIIELNSDNQIQRLYSFQNGQLNIYWDRLLK
jgi:hypothetical protein